MRRMRMGAGVMAAMLLGPALLSPAIAQDGTPAQTKLPAPADLPALAEPPKALVMFDGTPVKTPEQWRDQRRPELKALFQNYVYGYLPPAGKIQARVANEVPDLLGGKATLREIEIRNTLFTSEKGATCEHPPVIRLAVFIPNQIAGKNRDQPAPVFLALNRTGNHSLLVDKRITPTLEGTKGDPAPERGSAIDYWCVEQIIDHGYALATFVVDDVDPDKHDFTDGLHACLDLKSYPPGTAPGTIAAWAWGLHRGVDYLITDSDIDAKRICVTGHSRRGKTALFATAMDERIALVVPHQSGTGGMALSRGNDQETVERITRVFPHWFCDNFDAFAGHEDRLPVDQDLLVALVAPRPLLDTEGSQDAWANFPSSLRTLQAVSPVYEFLGVKGLVGKGLLSGKTPITKENSGRLLQYRLDTKHTLNSGYWTVMLEFADRELPAGKK